MNDGEAPASPSFNQTADGGSADERFVCKSGRLTPALLMKNLFAIKVKNIK